MSEAERQSINGVKLHVVRTGDAQSDQTPMLCLHGFPDIWSVWQQVVDHLPKDRLYILPDQRGYHLSDKPAQVDDYAPEILLEDIRQLIVTNSPSGKVVLIGHDWGGVIACWFAARFPDHVTSLVLINAVHPAALQTALIKDPAQRAASAYMTALKSGALEAAWRARPGTNRFVTWFQEALADGRMREDEAASYRATWSDPDRWRAAIDWYRASPFDLESGPELADWVTAQGWTIHTPTHVIWGEADPVFTLGTRDAMARYFTNLTVTALKEIGHNPVRDAPVLVAKAIHAFLNQGNQNV